MSQQIRSYQRYAVEACFIVAIVAAVPLAAHAHDEHDNLSSTGVTVRGDRLIISPEAEKSLGISTAVVHLKTLERDVSANAAVEVPWRQHAYATSLVAGRVARVLVRPGDAVEAGQELAHIESAEIETLQAELLRDTAELELANHLVEQRNDLTQTGSMSERRLLESQSARDGWAAARSITLGKLLALGMTQQALDRVLRTKQPVHTVPLTSPIGGVISVANVRAGQVVEPWQQVYEIVDMSTLWVHGQVLESDSTDVGENQTVEIRVDALPEYTFTGVVDHVGVKLDPELRSLHVHVEVPNPHRLLREGMFARLRIRATVVPDAVACPVEAIADVGVDPYVLVQDRAGVYLRQPVKLGLRSEGFVEVLDGLFPGDPVVIIGKQELASLFAAEAERTAGQATPGRGAKGTSTRHGTAAGGTAQTAPRPLVAQAQIELPTNKKAAAYSTVTGRIERVLVEHGQHVRAGEVLAEVDSLELRNVQLDFLQVQSRLRLAATLLDRYRRLRESGTVPEKDLWQAEADVQKLKATVDGLKSRLSLLGLTDEEVAGMAELDITNPAALAALRTTFEARAPIDGRITVFDLSIGQVVRPQDELFEIHDLSRVVARGYVHEQDAADVKVGQSATVTITADPKFSTTGVVDRTAPTLSTFSRAMSVWVDLENPNGKLKEGMLARLVIDSGAPAQRSKPSAAELPSDASAAKSNVAPGETSQP